MRLWTNRTTSILALCAAVSVYSCGSSPTAPGGSAAPGTGLTITFRDSAGQLDSNREAIVGLIQQAFDLAGREISIDGLAVDVTPGPRRIIRGWGVGGSALDRGRVELAVDPNLSPQLIDERLPSIAAHEFHHVARSRGPGYGTTLLRAMVSEGMADHFASELFGRPLPPWSVALSEEEVPVWIERARSQFDSQNYNHDRWFFGAGDVPNWTGYTVGFELVRRYKAANPGSSAVTLVNADANLFRP